MTDATTQTVKVADFQGYKPASELQNIVAGLQGASDFNQEVFATNIIDTVPDGHLLTTRSASKRGQDGISAILVASIPTIEEFERVKPGWVKEQIHHMLTMRMINTLNRADDLSDVKLPKTTLDFIDGMRSSGGGSASNFAAYNALWQDVRDALNKKTKGQYVLKKAELRSCLSNAAYATANFKMLEDAGVFVTLLEKLFVPMQAAHEEEDVQQSGEFAKWIATRDEQTFEGIDLGELDFAIDI
jgi:hypothetical protein